jgi:transposase
MAMGKRKPRQESLFVPTHELAQAPGHPFYHKLNVLLDEAGFDRWVEERCRPYYEHEEKRGRKSVPPGVYFRMLLIGYFEGIDSQRGIAWRCADSLGLRQFWHPAGPADARPLDADLHPTTIGRGRKASVTAPSSSTWNAIASSTFCPAGTAQR